jgi:Ca-activated chloride channel family protein
VRRFLTLTALVLLTTGGVLSGVERGNRLYRAGKYAEAVAEYRDALRNGDDSPTLRYNLGTALLKVGRYQEAQEQLEAALDAVDPELRQYVHYNLGQRYLEEARTAERQNPQAAAGLYDRAVEAYRQALRLRPNDADAKWNYELALRDRDQAMQQQGGGDGGQQDQPNQPQPGDQNQNQGGSGQQDPNADREQQRRPRAGQQPLTQEQAERILSGVEQDERELFRDKLRQGQPQRRRVRDW